MLKQNIAVNQKKKKSKCKVVSVIKTDGPLWNRMWRLLFPKTTATQIVLEYGSDVMSVKKLSKTQPMSSPSLNTQDKNPEDFMNKIKSK